MISKTVAQAFQPAFRHSLESLRYQILFSCLTTSNDFLEVPIK